MGKLAGCRRPANGFPSPSLPVAVELIGRFDAGCASPYSAGVPCYEGCRPHSRLDHIKLIRTGGACYETPQRDPSVSSDPEAGGARPTASRLSAGLCAPSEPKPFHRVTALNFAGLSAGSAHHSGSLQISPCSRAYRSSGFLIRLWQGRHTGWRFSSLSRSPPSSIGMM